jgi:mono/diheme cytochrome c family protein
MRVAFVTCVRIALLAAAGLAAPPPAPPPGAPPAVAAPPAGPGAPQFDSAAVERGQAILVAKCGFCHGSNGRGGAGGSDLTRSPIVQEDEGGKQLGAFLKVGRPEKNMPKFDLPDQEVVDVATFLHATIEAVSNRRDYKILDIVVGDAKAGAAYFAGAGGCAACHSATGNLAGVGGKYDAVALQQRMLMPRGGGGWGPGRRGFSAHLEPNAVKATVTAAGETATGALVRLTDFDVTLYDAASGQLRSWVRTDGVPAVAIDDPLQAHVDHLRKWTDRDMHNVTAYLVSLK